MTRASRVENLAAGDARGVALVAGRPQIIEGIRQPPDVDPGDYPLFNTNTLWATLEALRPLRDTEYR